ncbi:MAG: tyrosine-type recombinase/integrase [Nanoarchaeota archaeon]|nr:tyrosine-type recombinase/integrase [Nanoarchaeota archaeon]
MAHIEKNVHPRTLRHTFATHLAEKGHPVNISQSLLGHANPETIHAVAPKLIDTESPYDDL